MRALLRAGLAVLAISLWACSTPTPAPSRASASAGDCATDAECAIADFPDPSIGGCCQGFCEWPAVTTKEAERRRLAWEAECAAVRCAAGCGEGEPPTAACREGRCVAVVVKAP
jgi:hypothetical protein